MDKVVSVAQMREADGYTIENFIDSRDLMYRAGEAAYKLSNLKENVAIHYFTEYWYEKLKNDFNKKDYHGEDPSEVNEYDEYDEYEEHQDKDNDDE